VLLVVEVSDDTMLHDLQIKTKLYGNAGYPVYWVVTMEAIYEHTEPYAGDTTTGGSTRRASGSRSGTQRPIWRSRI
jgi:hypothetical protein